MLFMHRKNIYTAMSIYTYKKFVQPNIAKGTRKCLIEFLILTLDFNFNPKSKLLLT